MHTAARLPDRVENVEQLEELLSDPTSAVVETMARLEGDLIVLMDGEKAMPWRDVPFEASAATSLMSFDAAGKHLHMLSCLEHDKSALLRIDWSSGEQHVLFNSERADITGLIFNARTFEPEAVL